MRSDTGALQNRLQALQQRYSRDLPEKIRHLEETWLRFIEQGNQDALASLLHEAHNLTGSGAVYGYHQTSKTARELERLLITLQKSQRPPGPADRQRIEHCLQALHHSVHKPTPSTTPP